MSGDNRHYGRIMATVEGVVYDKAFGGEVACSINNLSETGIQLEIHARDIPEETFKKGKDFGLLFTDEITINNFTDDYVIVCNVITAWSKKEKDKITIGGYIRSDKYFNYVKKKKLSKWYFYNKNAKNQAG